MLVSRGSLAGLARHASTTDRPEPTAIIRSCQLDDGLFRPDVMLAKFGDRPNIPLPAYILGSDGERTVGATKSIDELRVQASLQGRIGDVLAGGGQPSPLAVTGFADH